MSEVKGKELGPGVPEALPRVVQRLLHERGAEAVAHLWLFPPLIRGRRESGLVAASCYVAAAPDADAAAPASSDTGSSDRRLLVTARYAAERTGKGLTLDVSIAEEGEAPADRFPRVMQGVVVRSGIPLGEASEVEIGGEPAAFDAWFAEVDDDLLDPALPPLAIQEELRMEEVAG
jgi:hypothetical protein